MLDLRSTLISLSQNPTLRHFFESSKPGRRMSLRFVAGTDVEEALQVAKALSLRGISATLDNLGENIASPREARQAADIYHRLLDAIRADKLEANVSVKLTHLGLDLDPQLAFELTAGLVRHACAADSFVRIDMEGTSYTQATIDMARKLHAIAGNGGRVGVVIQAYLYRSEADIAALIENGMRIRLCKGAYREPTTLAFPDKTAVDANFIKLMKMLLPSGIYHGIATHDAKLIAATREFARERKIGPEEFEFQMLYGVRRDLQRALVEEGYRVRVYVPFGREWYPYFMRRLAERPANLLFLARNLFRG
jgi:proline dehydrogenase